MKTLYCPVRRTRVSDLPEERVRQRLIQYLNQEKGYPLHMIACELSLSEIPHLKNRTDLPKRRIDLMCLVVDPDDPTSLKPFLLIECKAEQLGNYALQQVLGYNFFVGAPYVALVTQTHFKVVHAVRGEIQRESLIQEIPSYPSC